MENNYSDQLYRLIEDYLNKHINAMNFSKNFSIIYNIHVDYDTLTAVEDKLFEELSEITGRFSPYEEDLKEYNIYYDEEALHKKALEVWKLLRS